MTIFVVCLAGFALASCATHTRDPYDIEAESLQMETLVRAHNAALRAQDTIAQSKRLEKIVKARAAAVNRIIWWRMMARVAINVSAEKRLYAEAELEIINAQIIELSQH